MHCLWWACGLVREHRGDSHVAAAAAAGLNPVEMNILTELWVGMPLLSYTATRGWAPEVMQRAVESLELCGWLRDGGADRRRPRRHGSRSSSAPTLRSRRSSPPSVTGWTRSATD